MALYLCFQLLMKEDYIVFFLHELWHKFGCKVDLSSFLNIKLQVHLSSYAQRTRLSFSDVELSLTI